MDLSHIPILVLISCLIYEIKNKKVKFILISFTVILTLLNHYIEIFERPNTKYWTKNRKKFIKKGTVKLKKEQMNDIRDSLDNMIL
jgi:hypothetical protein